MTSHVRPANAAFVVSAASRAQFPRDGLPEVAFLGRSNVGKSSLLNALTARKGLARVSSTPGRTQIVNFFRVDPGRPRPPLYLVDLPGYGYAKAPQAVKGEFERMATSYLIGREPLAVVVFLVDIRHDPQEGDLALARFLASEGLSFILAATKADKVGRGAMTESVRSLRAGLGREAQAVLAVSASTGAGLPELWTCLFDAVSRAKLSTSEGQP